MDWRSIFFKNYKVKIALFLMAVFLWFFVVTSRNYNQILKVPVKLVNLKENKVFLNQPAKYAEVRFHGKGTSLLLLSLFGDAHFTLDLSTINYYYDFPLTLDQLRWASGINVEAVEIVTPDTVHVRIDDLMERVLKVKPMLTVVPAEKYVITGTMEVMPDTVLLRGAESVIKDLKFVPTQGRLVEKATGTVNLKLDLILPEEGIVSAEPSAVRVIVNVEKIITRNIADVPVKVIHCEPDKPGYAVPRQVEIKVQGAESLINKLVADSILISVSALSTPSPTGAYKPVVHLPENVELVEMIPDTVSIEYRALGDAPQ
jgi:hypothetical protein